jgi:hypothetical protein
VIRKVQDKEPVKTRRELELVYGAVWDTRQLARAFVILSVLPGEIVVRRKIDGLVGKLKYQDGVRYYYHFTPTPEYAENEEPSC